MGRGLSFPPYFPIENKQDYYKIFNKECVFRKIFQKIDKLRCWCYQKMLTSPSLSYHCQNSWIRPKGPMLNSKDDGVIPPLVHENNNWNTWKWVYKWRIYLIKKVQLIQSSA